MCEPLGLTFAANSAGAAGNFVAPISHLSVGAFKAVVDIDLIGSFITVKATLPYLLKSAERVRSDGKQGELSGFACSVDTRTDI